MNLCVNFKTQRVVMPEEDNIRFTNIQNMLEYPIIIAAGT